MTQDHHCVFPAKIGSCPVEDPTESPQKEEELSDLMFFSTKLFMIRYQEEEVELNDIGHFRIEMGLPSSLQNKEKSSRKESMQPQ
jgi:hypothetical protein